MHRNKITTTSNKFGALGCDGLLSAVKQSTNPGATGRYAYSIHTGVVAVRRRNQSGVLVSCSRGHRHLELLELDHRLQHLRKSKISSSLSATAASQAQQLTVEDPAVDAAAPQAVEQRYPGLNSWKTVKKEEWEGEMQVQGAIPTWLVHLQKLTICTQSSGL
jgi:2-polyprenyl-6-methoxyphenol hydroxylase-like FAD-dependent oxidoreductase